MTYWFISPKYRHGSKLALFACLLAFIVILLGAYTRLTNAGLSCPDWPNCYGFLTAPFTDNQISQAMQRYPTLPVDVKRAWTEMSHRYLAGTEGILVLFLIGSLLFSSKGRQLKTKLISTGLLGLLGFQIILGMLTVTAKLKPLIVLGHLLTGLSLLSLLWWTYLDLYLRYDFFLKQTKVNITPWLWFGFILLFLQITLGGWVSSHYAGLACVDFPYCNGVLFPSIAWANLNNDLISIHMLHRFGAMIVAGYMSLLGLYLLFKSDSLRLIGFLLFSLVILQILLGILNIIWLRPVWLAVLHLGMATLLLLTIITALVKTYYGSRGVQHA